MGRKEAYNEKETNPETRRFKTFPRESQMMRDYLAFRRKVQEKVNKDYKLMCKVLKLQALSKEMSNKLLRQRRNLGLLPTAKKSTKISESVEQSEKTEKGEMNISSVQRNIDLGEDINQRDIEEQLTRALENHLLKKKRTNEEEGDADWRNSCPVDMVPQSLALVFKDSLTNDNRFSVKTPNLFDKRSTKRKKTGQSDANMVKQMKKMGIDGKSSSQKHVKGEERRELGNWAKEKIRSFRNQYQNELESNFAKKRESQPESNKENPRLWVTDAFQNLKTDKSEAKGVKREANFSRQKKSASHLNTKKLVPQKPSQYSKKTNPRLYFKSNKTLNQFAAPKGKRKETSQHEALNLSKNISQAKREKEFWNRLGAGKVNSRMTRSFFLSKHGKSAVPSKPAYKKTKSKKAIGPKSKSALKRDLFKKGSSSFGNLFSEFRANYKNYKKKPDNVHHLMVSPSLSTKVITKGRMHMFGSKQRTRVKKKRTDAKVKRERDSKKEKRLPAISFRTMQEGRLHTKHGRKKEGQLEEGLNEKMLKILSKMENLKETVKAEKQKLIYSGQKSKLGVNSNDFMKVKQKSGKKGDKVNYSTKKTGNSHSPNDFMPNNLTFSGPQKLKHLGQMSNKKGEEGDTLEEERQELKLVPMTDLTREKPEGGGSVKQSNALYKGKKGKSVTGR